MKKVKVNVCLGTTCFVMGSSEFEALEDELPKELAPYVEITAQRCLGYCKDRNYGKAPFVEIDGEMVGEASIDRIIAKLEEAVRQDC